MPVRQRISDYIELTKPRLSALVLMTTAVGFWLGMRSSAQALLLVPLGIGMALVVGGANALNQWMEHPQDALMRRTQGRPVPSGRLSAQEALRFGLALSACGMALLFLSVSALSAFLAALSWVAYVLLYTPLKRRTNLCTLIGAIPGSLPPMIGWASSRGALDPGAWALFGILFVWQLPHFLSLAVLYREDYARAGFSMLPLVESGSSITARQMTLYGLTLLPLSLVPALIGVAGKSYFYGAAALGVGFFALAARAAWQRSSQSARQLFQASILYLPTLLGLLALNRSAF